MFNRKNDNRNILEKLCDFAFASAVIGVCTIGICPAFGVIGIVVPAVIKSKKAEVSGDYQFKNKKSVFLGIVSLVMFIVDLIIITLVYKHIS